MQRRYGQARRVWVMDRGMASAENIAWLRGSQRRYLIGASKSELKKFAGPLADRRDRQQVRDGVEAKVCAGPDGSETFLLGRSAERQQKEQAMHARFCERIETALAGLQRRIERARKPIDRGAAERQIRTPARPQLTRRRALCDQSRRRPNLAGWPAARMVEARRMGRLVASQRRLLCAAHQSARLDGRLRQTPSSGGKRHRRHPQPDRQHDDHPDVEEPLEADALVCVGHPLRRNQQQRYALQQRGPADERDDDRQRAAAPDIVAEHDRQAGGGGDHAGEQHPRPAARHLVERRQGPGRLASMPTEIATR